MQLSYRQSIRQTYRAKRRGLSKTIQESAAHHLLQQCLKQSVFIQAKKIALYLANDGELDPKVLISYCWSHNIQVYLPILHPFTKGHLVFMHYSEKTVMKPNRFGIAEPALNCLDICPLDQLDIVCAPLVAFDENGNRMGMGGGFYDRTLAPVLRDKLPTQLFGFAHDCQQANRLTIQSWDIPLQKIITPTRIIAPFFDDL